MYLDKYLFAEFGCDVCSFRALAQVIKTKEGVINLFENNFEDCGCKKGKLRFFRYILKSKSKLPNKSWKPLVVEK